MKYSVRMASVVVFIVLILFAAGCSRKPINQSDAAAQGAGTMVTCIGVLPAVSDPVAQGASGKSAAESLRQGTEAMDRLLRQELQGQKDVRFVGQDLLAGLPLSGGESSLELARMAGERIGCNAALETVVSRFDERVGGKYSVEKPAAVAFDFRLYALDSGTVLWSATYDEVQKPVTENIYEWKKARSRGFSWVNAEGLMQEGVRTKLRSSSYFSNARDDSKGR